MRVGPYLVLAANAALFAGGAWLGCSSDDAGGAADGGAEGASDVTLAPDLGAADAPPVDTEAITCDNYCARVMANCTGDAAQYADIATCKRLCADLPLGDAGDTGGDTVACRMYHAGAPAMQSASFHCPHAGPFGGEVCGTRCGAFCLLAGSACPTEYDAGACDAACGTKFRFAPDAGESPAGPTSGNTLNCREYHLVAAFGDPGTHCPHIVPSGGVDAGLPCQ